MDEPSDSIVHGGVKTPPGLLFPSPERLVSTPFARRGIRRDFMTTPSIRLYALIAASAFALALPARAVDSPSPMADKPKAATAAPKATSKAANTKKKKPK